MGRYSLNAIVVTVAVLIGVIAGLSAGQLARASQQSLVGAFRYGVGVFAGTVVFVLMIDDHLRG